MTDPTPTPPPSVPSPTAPKCCAGSSRCPGGLKAMAIVNFVIAGFGTVAVIALALGQDNRYDIWEIEGPVTWEHHLMICMRMAAVLTILFSGLGYLSLKRVQGWMLGNLYAVISLVNVLMYAFLLDEFGTSSLLWLPYPILTLFLLNTTYRKCFFRSKE